MPRTHNKRAENVVIKADEVPECWADKPAMRSQKDVDARWSEADQKSVRGSVFPTSKHGKCHYGTRNHVTVDRKHQLIRRYHGTDAAWRSAVIEIEIEIEAVVRARKLTSHIHRKGQRGKPLTGQAHKSNRTKSSVRVRVEHIFGAQANAMGAVLVRTIGLVRTKARIGTPNLACNMRRLGNWAASTHARLEKSADEPADQAARQKNQA